MRTLMKKVLSIVAAIAMVLTMSAVPAFAAGTDGSITISNPVKGESYSVYKVFDATYSGTNVAYTYDGSNNSTFLAALQDENSPFTVKSNTSGSYNVTLKTDKTAEDVVTFLNGQVSNFGNAVKTETGPESGNLEFTGLGYGYYYITTTTGSAVTIDSATKAVTVQEKNTVPSIDKKQSKVESDYADDDIDVNIGDTIYFQTTVAIGKGNDKAITVADTASAGLTIDTTKIVVKNGDVTLSQNTDYTLSTEGDATFTIVLKDTYVKANNNGSKNIVITYPATINANAAVNNTTAGNKNQNSVTLTYSNQTSTDTVYETTEDFSLKKTDGTNYLPGAGFRLYSDQSATTEIKLAKDNTGYYVAPTAETGTEISVDSADGVNIRGLAAGTYYLKETTTPAGYNTADIQNVTVVANETAGVTVINHAGSALPSTGGMGTTIFYVLGAALVIGAGVVLVTRKRLS